MTLDYLDIIREIFSKDIVSDLESISEKIPCLSKQSIVRYMSKLGYYSSYNFAGKYYTMVNTPKFDDYGLWQYENACFSKHGTLRSSVQHIVSTSTMGKTYGELKQIINIVTNRLLVELIRTNQLSRKEINGVFVYFSDDQEIAQPQFVKRIGYISGLQKGTISHAIIDALMEFGHYESDFQRISDWISTNWEKITPEEVQEIQKKHVLKKL